MSVNTLIASLSKAEKRHFKMYSKLNSSNSVPKYVKLFNLLDKKNDIKEEKLKSLGYNPVDKNFLGNKILESLQVFQTNLNPEQEVLQIIGVFPLLYDKNLWAELNKKLKQAKKICDKYELLELQLILFD